MYSGEVISSVSLVYSIGKNRGERVSQSTRGPSPAAAESRSW